MERMRRVRAEISPHDSAWRFSRELGVDVFLGHATFTGPDVLERGRAPLRFARAVIATGARPARPPDSGARRGGLPHERDRLRAHRAAGPPRGARRRSGRLRAGAGVPAAGRGGRRSRATARSSCPARTRTPREIVRQALLRDGVRLSSAPRSPASDARRRQGRPIREEGDARRRAADEILVGDRSRAERRGARARGGRASPHGRGHRRRRPPADHQPPHLRGRRRVPRLEVHPRGRRRGADRRPERAVRTRPGAPASRLVMPWCTYTDPEVAHVGLSEREARERGHRDRHARRAARGRRPRASPTARRRASSRSTCGGTPTGSSARPSSPRGPAR